MSGADSSVEKEFILLPRTVQLWAQHLDEGKYMLTRVRTDLGIMQVVTMQHGRLHFSCKTLTNEAPEGRVIEVPAHRIPRDRVRDFPFDKLPVLPPPADLTIRELNAYLILLGQVLYTVEELQAALCCAATHAEAIDVAVELVVVGPLRCVIIPGAPGQNGPFVVAIRNVEDVAHALTCDLDDDCVCGAHEREQQDTRADCVASPQALLSYFDEHGQLPYREFELPVRSRHDRRCGREKVFAQSSSLVLGLLLGAILPEYVFASLAAERIALVDMPAQDPLWLFLCPELADAEAVAVNASSELTVKGYSFTCWLQSRAWPSLPMEKEPFVRDAEGNWADAREFGPEPAGVVRGYGLRVTDPNLHVGWGGPDAVVGVYTDLDVLFDAIRALADTC